MHHIIETSTFEGAELVNTIASAAGPEGNKRLTVFTTVNKDLSVKTEFKVFSNNKLIISTKSLLEAIEKYNITGKSLKHG